MVEHRPWLTFLTHGTLILGCIIIAFPIYTTFVASTHSLDEITSTFPLLPGRHIIENYRQALTVGSGEVVVSVNTMMINSLIMALGIAFGKISISLLSAFAIVYFRFRFRMFFFWLIFITLMLPVEVRILPTFKVVADLGLLNSYVGLSLPIIASAGCCVARGAVPVFAGTMLITLIAMFVSVPIGLLSAIYLGEYASQRLRDIVKPLLEILAGVPTVVYGFFAALVVAPRVRELGAMVGLDVASESALAAGVVMAIAMIWTYTLGDAGFVPGLLPVLAIVLLGVVIWLAREALFGWAFIGTGLTIVAVVAAIFIGMYPNVMTSTINPDYSLTVFNASSTTLTLQIMTIVALIFVPIVLVYQSWSYWVFRKRVGPRDVTTSTH